MKKSTYFLSLFLTALFCLPWSSVAKADPIEITPENPYTNSFDTETLYGIPSGWTKVAGTNYYPSVDSKSNIPTRGGSARGLVFQGYSYDGQMVLAFPEFSDDIKYLTLEFYYKSKGSSYPATMSVGYTTSLTDKSQYHSVQTISYYTDGFTKVTVDYSTVTPAIPDGAYIAFSFAGTGASNKKGALYIDDVTVTTSYVAPAGSCAKPKTLVASSILPDGATFTWAQGGEETEYQYACVAQGATPESWTDVEGTERTLTLHGLTAGTAYDLYVRSNCGAEQSAGAKVTFTPTCPAPTAPVVSGISATSATLSWTAASGITDYQYIVVASGAAQNWTSPTLVEGATTAALTGLNPSTNYDVYVRSYYSATTQSTALKTSFQTACGAVTIPFTWDFSSIGCWTTKQCHASSGISSGAFSFHYISSAPYDQYLISPEFDALSGTVDVQFDYRVYSATYPETFALGYSKTTSDIASFTWLSDETVNNTSYGDPYKKTLPAGVKYIAIRCTSEDKYALYIDNFSVTEYVAPSCAAPTALTVTDITTNSASVSWTSEAASFTLEYKKTSDEDWTAATAPIVSPFVLANLTPNETEYTVRVKAICGENNESEWTELAEPFKTDCAVKTVTEETAWTEDFEAQTVDQAPACWEDVSSYAVSAYTQVNAGAAKDGSLGLQVYVYGTNTEIALLPIFNEEAKNLKLSFDYKNYGESSNYAALEVGYYAGSTFTNVVILDKTTVFASSGEIVMPNDAPDGARIAFRVVGKKSGYNSHAYIDNLSVIRKPACAVPTNLQAVATSTGATFTWTAAGDESQWNIRYREIAEPENVWTLVENVATGYAITDLLVDHNYEVQVQAYCDEDHQSAWTASTNFTPVCGAAPTDLAVSARSTNAATLTWDGTESAFKLQTSLDGETWSDAVVVNAKTYELSGLTAGTTYYVRVQNACGGEYATTSFITWCGLQEAASLPLNITSFIAIPECWEINFVGEYSGIANNVIYFYGNAEQMAVLPAYDIELNKLSVTFGYSTNNANLEFGYLDEPNGTFHAFASQPASGVELNLENEAAAAKYIAIRYTATSAYASGSISSVLLRKTPTCAKPTDLTATPAVGAASIDWTSEATAWNLQYKLASAADWTDAAVTAKPFEITSLAQGASYKVRVQANCGDELSDWSDEISFTTSCSGIDAIPYYADFSAELSSCWGVFAQNESYYKPAVNTAMQQLTMNGGKDGASNNVVVMPPFSADLSNAVINFEYSCSTGANYAQLEVGYVTDKADAATFVALGEPLAQSGSWTETRVATATVPADAYIALRYAGASSHGDLAIRNLRVIKDATLVDSENNEEALGALIGETVDVTINRTLTEGYYNTLCLPFDLETLDNTPLEGSELWGFKYGYVENGELLIRIVEAQQIVAGVPYLIIVPSTVVTPTFKDVVIRENIGKSVGETEEVKFVGILKPEAFSTSGDDVHKKLFLLPDNKLAWAGVANNLKSFRAYFRTTENVSGQPVAGIPARILREPSIATGCENVQDAVMSIKQLENNQIVIIRNGVKYNLQGQIIEKF